MGHLVQAPNEAGCPTAGCTGPCPGEVLNISREGDSTASLGSLGQGSVTFRGKKFFLIFTHNPGRALVGLSQRLWLPWLAAAHEETARWKPCSWRTAAREGHFKHEPSPTPAPELLRSRPRARGPPCCINPQPRRFHASRLTAALRETRASTATSRFQTRSRSTSFLNPPRCIPTLF